MFSYFNRERSRHLGRDVPVESPQRRDRFARREVEDQILGLCERQGMDLIVYSPVRSRARARRSDSRPRGRLGVTAPVAEDERPDSSGRSVQLSTEHKRGCQ
jgi:aryl-alcohol dehydrogenase-like predicted oxidoreductase